MIIKHTGHDYSFIPVACFPYRTANKSWLHRIIPWFTHAPRISLCAAIIATGHRTPIQFRFRCLSLSESTQEEVSLHSSTSNCTPRLRWCKGNMWRGRKPPQFYFRFLPYRTAAKSKLHCFYADSSNSWTVLVGQWSDKDTGHHCSIVKLTRSGRRLY